MPQTPKREQTRAQILAGAGRTFRSHGYDGSGVDSVAKAAGLTSGAFYAHFKSKAEAFRETVRSGMQELEQAIQGLRAEDESRWLTTFVDFYLGEKRTCAMTESCALQSLAGEVARADVETRDTFEAELRKVMDAVADGIDANRAEARRRQAILTLVLLSGGVTLARAVKDKQLSDEIAAAIRGALLGNAKRPRTSDKAPARPRKAVR